MLSSAIKPGGKEEEGVVQDYGICLPKEEFYGMSSFSGNLPAGGKYWEGPLIYLHAIFVISIKLLILPILFFLPTIFGS